MDMEEKIRKLTPLIGERKANALWNEYMIYPESRKEIEGIINALFEKHLHESIRDGEVFLLPPKEDQAKGEYDLGMVHYGKKC
jgi:hypothetical protein